MFIGREGQINRNGEKETVCCKRGARCMKNIYLTVRSLELDRLTRLWYHSGHFSLS